MSMAHALEVRCPLLDHRIIEFAARLPARLKLARRHAARCCCAGWRSGGCRPRSCRGPSAASRRPVSRWLREDLRGLLARPAARRRRLRPRPLRAAGGGAAARRPRGAPAGGGLGALDAADAGGLGAGGGAPGPPSRRAPVSIGGGAACGRRSEIRTGPPELRVLLFSTVFPNAAQPHHGVFVRERMRGLPADVEVRVVAPTPWFPFVSGPAPRAAGRGCRARRCRTACQVLHPRFLSFPGFLKCLDGLLLFLCTLPTLVAAAPRVPLRGDRRPLRLSRGAGGGARSGSSSACR